MEDFLNQISQQYIQERVNRLKKKILIEKKTIFNKIHSYKKEFLCNFNLKLLKKSSGQNFQNPDQIKNIFNFMRSSQSKEVHLTCPAREINSQQISARFFEQKQSQKCFMVFERACGNILDTYFPILMDEEFLSLQSEEQIDEKLLYLNSVVEKTAANLIKKLAKPDHFLGEAKKDLLIEEQGMDKEQSSIEISCQNMQKERKIKKRKGKNSSNGLKKGKNTKISTESTYVMQKWLLQNFQDPYPTMQQKSKMSQQSGLTVYQVNNWFINARQRVIKKYLKKENVPNLTNNKSRKNSSQDQECGNSKRQKKLSKRENYSKSQVSEQSLRGSRQSSEGVNGGMS